MVRALQKKFVKTAMIAVTVLLLVVVCAISGINAYSELSDAEGIVEMLADNSGIPDFVDGGIPQIGRMGLLRGRSITEDSAMSARYFLVKFRQDGEIEKTDTSRISSVTASEAKEIAQEIYDSSGTSGVSRTGIKRGMLYCIKSQTKSEIPGDGGSMQPPQEQNVEPPSEEENSSLRGAAGGTVVVGMDISGRIRSMGSVLLISLTIGVAAWFLMLLLVILLSRRAIAPIAENIVRQKQFVTNAGHEIKTPLAIILANTDALELYTGESKWTRNIRSQTQRLSGLMQNLLTLSKMDETDLQLPMSEFDLGALAKDILRQFEESAAAGEILLSTEMDAVTVRANRESIAQLIGILLDNAVKYTPKGGTVHICVRREGKHAILEESNTIDPSSKEEDPEKLFDRFYRSDRARTQKSGGYGIGLSAARAIAAANRAVIKAVYRNDYTIVFTLQLMI